MSRSYEIYRVDDWWATIPAEQKDGDSLGDLVAEFGRQRYASENSATHLMVHTERPP